MNSMKNHSRYRVLLAPLLAGALLAGCSGSQDPILGTAAISGVPAPTVTAVAPGVDATNVPINTAIVTATFSEPMQPIAGGASFVVTCDAPCVSPGGTVALDMTNTIATLTLPPLTTLSSFTTYTATITGATSLAEGVPLAAPYVWQFVTSGVADTVRPTVTITAPVTTIPGPTLAVPTNTAITAVFSEDMISTSITAPARFTLTCLAPCVSPTGIVSYAVASNTATFTPDAPLDAGTTYTATIAATVTDLALNGLSGNQLPAPPAASAYLWEFTTAAAVPPADITVDPLTTKPLSGAVDVCPTHTIAATFDVPSTLRMADLTLNAVNFTVTGPGPLFDPVSADSIELDVLTGQTVTFTPSVQLTEGVVYTATIKGGATGVKDQAIPANEMLADYSWSFTAGPATGVCLPPVQLGALSTFGIAATAGITNTGATTINGDVVLDPTAECNSVTVDGAGGFGLCNGLAPTLNGLVISPLYPDAGVTSGAIKDQLLATYLSITPPSGPPAAGSLGGATSIAAGTTLGAPAGDPLVAGDNLFVPGVYQSLTSILITGDLTLDAQGDSEAVFVFQSSSTIGTAAGAISPGPHTRILLINGAKASNVFWQAATSATLGTYTEFEGNILAGASITMETGATSCGRLLAGAFTAGQFVFDSNVVSVPGNGCLE